MILELRHKFRLVNLLFTAVFLFLTIIYQYPAQGADKQDSAIGELKIEGEYIERLILQRQGSNDREEFRRPEQIIKLPTGKYYLHEVHLEGGYICYASRELNRLQVNITHDEPATLKIGAPLKQIIKVSRKGRNLEMNYELLGVGGEKYTSANRGEKPAFTVYKKDKEIASDKFEFG